MRRTSIAEEPRSLADRLEVASSFVCSQHLDRLWLALAKDERGRTSAVTRHPLARASQE
jgi:hypothetical protein